MVQRKFNAPSLSERGAHNPQYQKVVSRHFGADVGWEIDLSGILQTRPGQQFAEQDVDRLAALFAQIVDEGQEAAVRLGTGLDIEVPIRIKSKKPGCIAYLTLANGNGIALESDRLASLGKSGTARLGSRQFCILPKDGETRYFEISANFKGIHLKYVPFADIQKILNDKVQEQNLRQEEENEYPSSELDLRRPDVPPERREHRNFLKGEKLRARVHARIDEVSDNDVSVFWEIVSSLSNGERLSGVSTNETKSA
ncbi:hypothetical protein [Mesorhizobium australicum]|uniref:Uncharacterized protein n=1 Tax=Mesorhizobium australicum TaxID=536018 RepID=A0A1X7MZ08_9HYPH|nr:hypothetical protein [Mesorhizobium australicum]SMH30148.1 hypothetical protein SAMN02982922_1001 [Mesorhizobium australicum]